MSPAMRVPKGNPLVKYPPCPACGKPIALDDSFDPPGYYCHLCQVSFSFDPEGTFLMAHNGAATPTDFEKEFPHIKETFAWGQARERGE
jgi:hypothetical protein